MLSIIRQLLERQWGNVSDLFKKDLESTAEEIILVRNYIVHRDSRLGDLPDYGAKVHWLTEKCVFLMKSCLLSELGFSEEEKAKMLRQNALYSHIATISE
jgi:hypothetical protein